MGLLSFFRRGSAAHRDRRSPEERRFGTGLWRQHRNRFSRAVDRFFESVSQLHREVGQPVPPHIEQLAQLTHTLNGLDERVAVLAEAAQRAVPLDGLVFPAAGRSQLGDVPEHLSRASALVAQSAQAAAMLRAHHRMGAVTDAEADRLVASAVTYTSQAEGLLAEVEAGISSPPDPAAS